jgi:hypothetical protein
LYCKKNSSKQSTQQGAGAQKVPDIQVLAFKLHAQICKYLVVCCLLLRNILCVHNSDPEYELNEFGIEYNATVEPPDAFPLLCKVGNEVLTTVAISHVLVDCLGDINRFNKVIHPFLYRKQVFRFLGILNKQPLRL